jgi:signal transduction histidine kinase
VEDRHVRLLEALEAARMAAWELDFRTGLVTFPGGADWLGYEAATPVPVESLVGDVDPADRELVWRALSPDVESHAVEFRAMRSSGATAWFASRGRVVRDAAGTAVRIVGVLLDITHHKNADLRLSAQFEIGKCLGRAATLAEAAPELLRLLGETFGWAAGTLWRVDRAAGVLRCAEFWKQHSEDLVEFEVETRAARLPLGAGLPGQIWAQGAPVWLDDVASGAGERHRTAERGRLHAALGFPVVVEDVVVGVLEFYSHQILPPDAELLRMLTGLGLQIGQFIDRKALEAERASLLERERNARELAEQAGRAKDEFLATLSHELRTPLTAILGWVRLLRTRELDSDAAGRAVEIVDRNARALARVVEDILDVSKIVTGKLRLEMRPLDLRALVEEAVQAVRPAAEAKKLVVDTTLDSEAAVVHGDAVRLYQVFWNLMTNAVKFTPAGGRIGITLRRREAQVEVEVRDEGEGIPPGFIDSVFDPFRQADSALTRRHGGLGIGLSIVKHVVEQHGGTVEACSDGPGSGAVFVVRLTLDSQSTVTGETAALGSAPCLPALDGRDVLVLHADADTRALIAYTLSRCGARVSEAISVDAALARVDGRVPGVVILEGATADGLSALRQLRTDLTHPLSRVPAVALTDSARGDDRLRVLAAGFQSSVKRPIDPTELAVVVASLMGPPIGGH